MSGSEDCNVEGVSDLPDPCAALAGALDATFRAMAAAHGSPAQLKAMTWTAAEPAAIHPARPAVDRLYREVFGGWRPPIGLERGAAPGVTVRARLTASVPVSSEPLWHGHAGPALAREYSPRGQVPSMAETFAGWTREGAAFRAAFAGSSVLDLAYGPGRMETLDLHLPAGVGRPPLWVFIHGGYWQASDKDQHSQFSSGMLGSGFAVANVNYGLAPDTDIAGATAQVRRAIGFLAREAGNLGVDAAAMHVAGHSAGGHLAAMAAADPDGPPLKSVLLLSGLFDLEPLTMLPFAALLGLNRPDAASRLSPTHLPPPRGMRIGVALGALESAEFKWQSEQIAAVWGAAAPMLIDRANHFSLLESLRAGLLLDFALSTAEG